MRAVIIGAGGVGCHLIRLMDKFMFGKGELMICDGDSYEPKNMDRQYHSEGKKAYIISQQCKTPTMAVEEYFGEDNKDMIEENDFVFSCVDNHKTRLDISKRCQELNNITLISGGNELTDGNIQVYIRREGKDITPTIECYHPEIAVPKDRSPADSCEILVSTEPQLIFTNNMVSALMVNAFWKLINGGLDYQEVYFDLNQNKAIPKVRNVKTEGVNINGEESEESEEI